MARNPLIASHFDARASRISRSRQFVALLLVAAAESRRTAAAAATAAAANRSTAVAEPFRVESLHTAGAEVEIDSGSEAEPDHDARLLAGIRASCRRAGLPPRLRGGARRANTVRPAARVSEWRRSPVYGAIRRAFALAGPSPDRSRAIASAGTSSVRAAAVTGAFPVTLGSGASFWIMWPAANPNAIADIFWRDGDTPRGTPGDSIAAATSASAIARAALAGDTSGARAAAVAALRQHGQGSSAQISATAAEIATVIIAMGCTIGTVHALNFLTSFDESIRRGYYALADESAARHSSV